jgi:ATP-dependent phosphofructokinase / diphosphate-dependent phosphofructokinase
VTPSQTSRACIVVGGGDAPGVNAVIRGFVHASASRGIELMGCHDGFEGLLAPNGIRPLDRADVRGILPRGGCALGCSTRVNPFFVPQGEGKEPQNLGPEVVARLRGLRVNALVLVGGDGTMHAAKSFAALGMPCVGIAKTIDSDVEGADVTVGFDTAVAAATHAIDALHSTAEAHARVMVVEVMGRHAGWLALQSGIAGGADVILLPELPYRLDRVIAKIREREAAGLRFSIVVISEGARPIEGDLAFIEAPRPGHLARLGGAGQRLADALDRSNLGHEVRLTVLGHLQRGGTPTAFDRMLGTRLGVHAAELCALGTYGRMATFKGGVITSVAFDEVKNKCVDPAGSLVAAARDLGLELGA